MRYFIIFDAETGAISARVKSTVAYPDALEISVDEYRANGPLEKTKVVDVAHLKETGKLKLKDKT